MVQDWCFGFLLALARVDSCKEYHSSSDVAKSAQCWPGPCKLHTPSPVTDGAWDIVGLRVKPQGNVVISMVCKLSCNSNNKGSIIVPVTISLPGICSYNWSLVSLTQLFTFRNLESDENVTAKERQKTGNAKSKMHSALGVLSVTCAHAGVTEDSGLAWCPLGMRFGHLTMVPFTIPDADETSYFPLLFWVPLEVKPEIRAWLHIIWQMTSHNRKWGAEKTWQGSLVYYWCTCCEQLCSVSPEPPKNRMPPIPARVKNGVWICNCTCQPHWL